MRETLVSGANRRIEFYPVALELIQLRGVQFEQEFAALLRKKYQGIKVDLILADSTYALNFAERHRADLWPGTPVVFYAVPEADLRDRKLSPGTTGQTASFDLGGTIELAVRLQPDARDVVVVGGLAASDRYWNVRAAEELRRYEGRLQVTWLTNLAVPQILDAVGNLSPNTIVLYTTMAADASGHTYLSFDVLERLAGAAKAPVYGLWDIYVGLGIVGGSVYSPATQGKLGAQLALRVLSGENPDVIPVQPPPKSVPTVDWRQLKRWGISETRLPAGCEVRFREPTFWEQYKSEIITVHVLVLTETFLILFLVRNQQRLRRTQSVLRESEERFRAVVEQASDGFELLDSDGRYLEVNETSLRQLGYTREEILRLTIFDVDLLLDRDRFIKESQTITVAQPMQLETVHRRKDGTTFPVEVTVSTIQIGGLRRLFALVRDITARKQAEQEIVQQRNELAHVSRVSTMGQLASTLAHELNQPLGAILRNAEAAELFLQSDPPDLEEVREILADIRKDDQRAGEVIDRMRALLKRRGLEHATLDIAELVDDVVLLVHPDAVTRKVKLDVEVPRNLPPVRGDRVHLQQVLLNLILNGMDAMGEVPAEARRLVVRARQADAGTIEVAVADAGHGVPAEKFARLFEPFFTTNPTAWAWDCPSPPPSSKRTVGGFGPKTAPPGPRSTSPCLSQCQGAGGK